MKMEMNVYACNECGADCECILVAPDAGTDPKHCPFGDIADLNGKWRERTHENTPENQT